MIDWLNDNSGAVQAIAVVVLVTLTAVYPGREDHRYGRFHVSH